MDKGDLREIAIFISLISENATRIRGQNFQADTLFMPAEITRIPIVEALGAALKISRIFYPDGIALADTQAQL